MKKQNGSCTDNDGDLDVNDTLIWFEPRKIMLLKVQKRFCRNIHSTELFAQISFLVV